MRNTRNKKANCVNTYTVCQSFCSCRRRLFDLVRIGLKSPLARLGVDDGFEVELLIDIPKNTTNNYIKK